MKEQSQEKFLCQWKRLNSILMSVYKSETCIYVLYEV